MSWHIVHTEASCGWGGQEIRILTESQGMLERGHRVSLLTPASSRIHEEALKLGIDVVAMPYEKKSLAAIKATKRWFAANPADVVNTHSSIDSWMVGLALTAKNAPPVVRTRHISAKLRQSFPTRWLYNRSAQRVVTTGQKLADEVTRDLRCAPGHVVSVPTGIDLARYNLASARPKAQARAASGIPETACVIGIAATLRSWKGHVYLLEAFEQLAASRPALHLLVVGDGPMRPAYEEQIAASVHANRIHLVGHQADVENWLTAMDVFALPSYANEGVPQSLMQAMAMQLPVVTTTVGAITELVDAHTGLHCRIKDSDDLAAKLASLIDDPAQRDALIGPARERVETRFSKQAMVDAMQAVFADVIGAR